MRPNLPLAQQFFQHLHQQMWANTAVHAFCLLFTVNCVLAAQQLLSSG